MTNFFDMNIETRISAFSTLGTKLKELVNSYDTNQEFRSLLNKAKAQNPWFTIESSLTAINGICFFLEEQKLKQWISRYNIPDSTSTRNVGIVMAGNIPLVGFHDFLCVLMSGHNVVVKLSSKDKLLIRYITDILFAIEPQFKDKIILTESYLNNFDAVIATGSNNSARYFDYYFRKYPNIIRRNRTSVAILTRQETDEQIGKLGKDIFTYFGLGCRNVSKIYIPEGFEIRKLMEPIEKYSTVVDHFKYCNNYDYNKSIYLINGNKHYDNGFLLVKEDSSLFSPLAVLHYEEYKNIQDVKDSLLDIQENIQCIVSTDNIYFKENVEFGATQSPQLWDYADSIDTMEFLISLQ